MKAMITGASSGIGRDIALNLAKLNYDLILVGRDREALESVKTSIDGKVKVKIIVVDLSNLQKVKELYVLTKNDDIDILINNAGFGVFGEFVDIDLNTEINMLDVNIRALDMLTKFYLKDMLKKDKGIILNVASSAAFMSGPMLSSYYATKSYVYRLSLAINEELRRRKSKVSISVLCPGPVDTNFNNRAGVSFKVKALSSSYVADYAVKRCLWVKQLLFQDLR